MTTDDVAAAYGTIREELEAYGHGLADKPEIVALSKCDTLIPEQVAEQKQALAAATGGTVHAVSAATGEGVQPVLAALSKTIKSRREAETTEAVAAAGWRP